VPPEHHRWFQAPKNRRSPPSPGRTFRLSGRGAAFLGSRQFPQHLILPHGHPHTVSGSMPCLLVTYALATWRQAKVCLRPLSSYGEDRASRPPPLQHRVPILAAGAPDLSSVSAQRRPYPDRSGAFSVTGQAILGTGANARTCDSSVSASRLPGHTV